MKILIGAQERTMQIEDNLFADNDPPDFCLKDTAILKLYFPPVEHLINKLRIDAAQLFTDYIARYFIDRLPESPVSYTHLNFPRN